MVTWSVTLPAVTWSNTSASGTLNSVASLTREALSASAWNSDTSPAIRRDVVNAGLTACTSITICGGGEGGRKGPEGGDVVKVSGEVKGGKGECGAGGEAGIGTAG